MVKIIYNAKKCLYIIGLALLWLGQNGSTALAYSHNLNAAQIAVVAETKGQVEFYDSETQQLLGQTKVGDLPHEIAISDAHRRAYVSNFGLQDYDETIGQPGDSISVIDLNNYREIKRIDTGASSAPHGVKLRPNHWPLLYVNTESNHQMLIINAISGKILKRFDVPQGTHNFEFSDDGRDLWLIAAREGVLNIDPDTGKIRQQFQLASPIRGLKINHDQTSLLVSGVNEIAILDYQSLEIQKRFTDLQVSQILYADMTSDDKLIVAPAVWNNLVLIINAETGEIIKRIVTGIDPVWVKISEDNRQAIVSNARGAHVSIIDLQTFAVKNMPTGAGPNGLSFMRGAKQSRAVKQPESNLSLTLGVPVALSGENYLDGREIMLGLEYWKNKVNTSGGIMIDTRPHFIDIVYEDAANDTDNAIRRLLQDRHADILSVTEELIPTASRIRDSLSTQTPIMRQLSSLKRQEDFMGLSKRYTDVMSFTQEFSEAYNLAPTENALRAVLSGILIEHQFANNLYIPEGQTLHPGLLLFHASSGVTQAERRWAKLLQQQGYAVYIVDSFMPRAYQDRLSAGWDNAVAAQKADVVDAYYLLAKHHAVDANKIALIGFSLGGHSVLNMMQQDGSDFAAQMAKLPIELVLSFYGDFTLLDTLSLKGQIKIFVGSEDDRLHWSSPHDLLLLTEYYDNIEAFIYPGAKHAFDNSDLPASLTLTDEDGQVYHLGFDYHVQQQAIADVFHVLANYRW